MNYRGFLLFELLVAIALFLTSVAGIVFIMQNLQITSQNISLRLDTSRKAEDDIDLAYSILENDFFAENLPSSISIINENDFTKILKNSIYQRRITNTSFALGQNTCSNDFDQEDIEGLEIQPMINMTLGNLNKPTDLDVVGDYLFLTSNSSIQSDPDFYIYDIHDIENPILISSLNTGPGAASVHIVGNYAYLANQSINGQLQVIDLTDINVPKLIKTIKLPGTYTDNTVVGNKITFINHKLFLATPKSSIAELHAFDVSDLSNPIWKGSYEINAGPNDLMTKHTEDQDFLYVASPSDPELILLDVTDVSEPIQIDQFDAPTGIGNGKSLGGNGNNIALGRTVGNKELYLLTNYDELQELSSIAIGSSISAIILRKNYVFSLISKTGDQFQVFGISSSAINKATSKKFSFGSDVLTLDCDKKSFFILTSNPSKPFFIIKKS